MKLKELIFLKETVQQSQKNILNKISAIVEKIMKNYDYQTEAKIENDYVETVFKGKYPQSITWKIIPTNSGYILKLINVYIPNDLIGKGVMTRLLKEIRSLSQLNGECWVSVAVNIEGWKKIVKKAGFEWYAPEIDWLPKNNK